MDGVSRISASKRIERTVSTLALIMMLLPDLSGVIAVSWYPPGMKDDNGEPTEDIVSLIMDVAAKYKVKVGGFSSSLPFYVTPDFMVYRDLFFPQVLFHIEPYKGRDDNTMRENIKYIIDK